MADATTPATPATQAEPPKPTEISVTYKGPDLKTLAIGGGMLVGVAHAANQVFSHLGSNALGALTPAATNAAAAAGTAAVSV